MSKAYNNAISRKSGLPNKKPTTLIMSTANVPNAFKARTLSYNVGPRNKRMRTKINEIRIEMVAI
ncbi:MAG: hypothetical protein ACJZ8S_06310 [Paracoccaceae bacterium]